jgi:hypothetical protein
MTKDSDSVAARALALEKEDLEDVLKKMEEEMSSIKHLPLQKRVDAFNKICFDLLKKHKKIQ